jgi:tetratricopeptide (TPR) repeat protein
MIGELLQNRYRVDAKLGEGGMGAVFAARDLTLDRDVAVKVLVRGTLDDAARERLLREARAAAALNHPHIVAVYDAGEAADGTPFVVMERVDGAPLGGGPMPVAELLAIADQLCDALGHAHANGIVHRDLKPENVLVTRTGVRLGIKLADLGVALTMRGSRLTADGAFVGTAHYMAPEQALGQAVDGRADLYALGAMMYELATGRRPFEGDDALAVISQHLHAPVVPPRTWRADLPRELESLIVRLLAKTPEERYASASEVRGTLAGVTAEPSAEAAPVETSDRVALLRQLARGRLVGRRAELDQLREMWRMALQGQGAMVLLSGEPGIGKTRLAHELVVYARLSGALVLTGGCYEFEATTPYLPFVEAIGQWVRGRSDEQLREDLGPTATEIAKLAPAIAARIGPLTPNTPLGPQEERIRLFDHVALLLQRLASSRGLLLVLDDLHWADHGTLALLRYVLRQLRDQRLLVLGAYREAELDRAHPLNAALVEWNRERLATRVALGRFGETETSNFLATLFGQEQVSPDFAAALHRETEGNPFFVEEVVKALIEEGQIYREGGAWQRRDVQSLSIPQGVKAAIGHRLSRLTPECAEVLHTAAALGKVFAFEELAAVARSGEDVLLDALDEAAGAQLIRAERDDRFIFTHDKIREVLRQELNPIRKRRLHLQIAKSLETLYASELADHAPDLAYHFAESSDLRKGLEYSLEAAAQSQRVFALEEAVGHYDRARDCAEALEATGELAAIERGLGDCRAAQGHRIGASGHYQRAIALSPDPTHQGELHVHAGLCYAQVGDSRGVEHLEKALAMLDPGAQPTSVALAKATLGRYEHYRGRHGQAIEFIREALAIAEPTGDPQTLRTCYVYLAGAHQHLAQFEESDRWARATIALGERLNDDGMLAVGHEFLAENAITRGDWSGGIEHGMRDEELGRRAGSFERQAWGAFSQSWGLLGRGHLASAAETIERTLALCDRIEETRLAVLMANLQVMTAVERGDDEAVRRGLARLVNVDRDAVFTWAIAGHARATALAVEGCWAEAAALMEEMHAGFEGRDSVSALALLVPLRVRTLIEVGRHDEALALVDTWLARTQGTDLKIQACELLKERALIEAVRGDAPTSETSFAASIAGFERSGSPHLAALAATRRARARTPRPHARGSPPAAPPAASPKPTRCSRRSARTTQP